MKKKYLPTESNQWVAKMPMATSFITFFFPTFYVFNNNCNLVCFLKAKGPALNANFISWILLPIVQRKDFLYLFKQHILFQSIWFIMSDKPDQGAKAKPRAEQEALLPPRPTQESKNSNLKRSVSNRRTDSRPRGVIGWPLSMNLRS